MKRETKAYRSCRILMASRGRWVGANPQVSLAFRSTLDGLQLKKGLRFRDEFSYGNKCAWQGSDYRSSLSPFHSRNTRVHGAAAAVGFLGASGGFVLGGCGSSCF